ncbi:MAG: hypothetical protein M1818_000570 [Claussenomyces sp. TS43310]|nr:MAG: hypothetical protein M1818_000570 [Claussenomyces sp. TS43310]
MLLSIGLVATAWASVVSATTSYASKPTQSTIEPSPTQVQSSEATATGISPVSNVQGLAFDRIIQIWLENTDYDLAASNPDMRVLAKEAITLTNYYATTHPSEPNYAAVVGGDNFGLDADDFNALPANISTVVDLLDTKGISWAEYQEHIPYAGFQGFNYSNQQNFANDYVRKHNPLVLYQSVTSNATRLSLIKSFESFNSDVKAETLPQWSFVTPNMTNDGHDTTIAYASTWSRSFIEPMLSNPYVMNNTLIILTFDEVETYTTGNKVFALLLGGAIPSSLKGTTDDTYYNHYSTISTVSANWGLPSLGRWDCGANILELVANKTGYKNSVVNTTELYFNSSYPGPLSTTKYIPSWPIPDTDAKCANGLGVLSSIVSTWGHSNGTYNYSTPYPYDEVSGTNVVKSESSSGTSTSGGSGSASSASASQSTTAKPSSAASMNRASDALVMAAGAMAAALL